MQTLLFVNLDDAGWHIGLVYPKREIYGDYYMVIGIIVLIGVIGLIILFIGCRMVTHRQLLPLRMLSDSAQRISEGNYNDVIPDTRQQDEVGTLQNHFQQMQQALSVHVGELERLTNRLRKQGDVLSKSYDRIKEADRVKTAFLHHMTDQMIPPVSKIESDVESLEAHVTDQQEEGIASLVQESFTGKREGGRRMKNIVRYFHQSLSLKLSIGVLLMTALIFFATLGIVFVESRRNIRQESIDHAASVLNNVAQNISRYLNTVETATNANAQC